MKKVEVAIYKFEELSKNAKEEARLNIEEMYTGMEMDAQDINKTMENFASFFDISLKNWQLDSFVRYTYSYESNVENMDYLRLRKYLLNNYYDAFYLKRYYGEMDYTKLNKISKNRVVTDYSICAQRISRILFKDTDCPFTGVCWDIDILKPLNEFIRNPTKGTTWEHLFDACFKNLINAYKISLEYYESDEYIIDTCNNNNHMFFANGQLYNLED